MSGFPIKNLIDSDYPEESVPSAAVMTADYSDSSAFGGYVFNAGGDHYMGVKPNTEAMNLSQFFPIVKGIKGKMTHRPVPENLGNSNFRTKFSWPEISEIVMAYFEKKGIRYIASKATAAFTVTSSPFDSRLQLDIIAYLEESGSYIMDFKRISGDVFLGADIFSDLKCLLTEGSVGFADDLSPNTVVASVYEDSNDKSADEIYDFDALLN